MKDVRDENQPPSKRGRRMKNQAPGRRGSRGRGRGRGRCLTANSNDANIEDSEDDKRRSSSRETAAKRRRPSKSAFLRGQNDSTFRWCRTIPSRRSSSSKPLRMRFPTVLAEAKDAERPLDVWKCLCTDTMIQTVTTFTNMEIERTLSNVPIHQTYHHPTEDLEISALIGLLYLAGLGKQSKMHVDDLWGTKFTPTIYRQVMPVKRFLFLLKCLRFDDRLTRQKREKTDRFAAIRDLWTSFIDNSRRLYSPYEICTIDEQMSGFKGRCKFRMYLPAKPDRYGLKFIMINDSKTSYMLDVMPYLGKESGRINRNEPVANFFVRKLVESIRGSGRTVVMDNWFTSTHLFTVLKKQYDLNALGTLRKNKKEVPAEFIQCATDKSARYCYHEDLTLLPYIPRKQKIILALSSGIRETTNDNNFNKPTMIVLYNKNKGGTDTFDQKVKLYTVARRTRRWPLRVFYSILDFANVNANILYNLNTLDNKIIQKNVTKEPGMSLVKPLLEVRFNTPTLPTNLKNT